MNEGESQKCREYKFHVNHHRSVKNVLNNKKL